MNEELDIKKMLGRNKVGFQTGGKDPQSFVDSLVADIQALIQAEVLKARQQAILAVKKQGYGYDDGSGFVLKISYKELAELQKEQL